MGRKSIDIPSITPIPLRRKELDSYDSQKNGSIQTKIANNYSLRMKAPSNINNCYGAIISERNETYLPKIKSNNNISADMKQINTTLDETNRVVSRIDNINSQTPLTHKRINFEPRIKDLSNSPITKPNDNLGVQISKFNNLNLQKFKEHLQNKIQNIDSRNSENKIQIPIIRQRNKINTPGGVMMSVDKIDRQLNMHVKNSLNNGFNPISNTFDRQMNNSRRYYAD